MPLRVPPNSFLRDRFLGSLIVRFFFALIAADPSGLHATSWYRNPRQNADAGGKPESQHLAGLAVDFDGPEERLLAFQDRLRSLGLTTVLELTHLHVQAFPAGFLGALGATGEGEPEPEVFL